jgi:hypothetical protein
LSSTHALVTFVYTFAPPCFILNMQSRPPMLILFSYSQIVCLSPVDSKPMGAELGWSVFLCVPISWPWGKDEAWERL